MPLPALAFTLFLALLADGPAPPPSVDAKAYEAMKAKLEGDPEGQVKLSLWCEAHHLDSERLKHLERAIEADPKDAKARGLMGQVQYQGAWATPETVGEGRKADEAFSARIDEYRRRRETLDQFRSSRMAKGIRPNRASEASSHVKLALWCEQAGLKDEATAHFTSAVVLDPSRDAHWKHLGYHKQDGRWVGPGQLAAERAEAEAQHQADLRWEPLLKKWRAWLGVESKRGEAEQRLAEIVEPRAVGPIARVFVGPKEADQKVAVQLLGQIDTPASTRLLAELAVFGASPRIRTIAIETLRPREPRDYAGRLVEMIHSRMKYQAEPVRGPGSPGGLLVETPRYRVLRTYDAPVVATLGGNRTGYIGYDANGLPVAAYGKEVRRVQSESPEQASLDLAIIERRTAGLVYEANLKAADSQQRLLADVSALEATNAQSAWTNERVIPVLSQVLGAPAGLGDDEDNWHGWWYDKLGYNYQSQPQVTLAVNASPQYPPPVIVSCFAAGTPVLTADGRRPIETLVVGDQVLSQDASTGELSFRPILVVHHNPPGSTIRVELDSGETLTASIYHRFWLAGKGWALARDLRAGDVVRTRSGRSTIRSATAGPVVPVFNLDVAGPRTFFVGEHDALVHDNTLPALRIVPFDLEPASQ